jgi:hypothetical protein
MTIQDALNSRKSKNKEIAAEFAKNAILNQIEEDKKVADEKIKKNQDFIKKMPKVLAEVLVGLYNNFSYIDFRGSTQELNAYVAALIIAEVDFKLINTARHVEKIYPTELDGEDSIGGESSKSILVMKSGIKKHPEKLEDALYVFNQIGLDKDSFLSSLQECILDVTSDKIKTEVCLYDDFHINNFFILDEVYINEITYERKLSKKKVYKEGSNISNLEIHDLSIRVPKAIKRNDYSKLTPELEEPSIFENIANLFATEEGREKLFKLAILLGFISFALYLYFS